MQPLAHQYVQWTIPSLVSVSDSMDTNTIQKGLKEPSIEKALLPCI